jgi:hypothetical protein
VRRENIKMDNKQELVSLFDKVTDAEQQEILGRLREMAYMDTPRTLDEMIKQACDRKNLDEEHRKMAVKLFVVYRSRVMMAMYYVEMFEIRRWGKRLDQIEMSLAFRNWHPFLDEVAQKLQLSEDEIRCLGYLFHDYFLPRAEKLFPVTIRELMERAFNFRDDFEQEYKKSTFEISKIKDLAKLYMTQRFQRRMNSILFWCEDNPSEYKEQVWRNILASEQMSASKRERLMKCPREDFCGEPITIRFSAGPSCELTQKEKREGVLQAYEALNQRQPYSDIMRESGLSFEEVRILDCFTVRKEVER